MTSLTSTALWSNALCWGNWEDGQWWLWYIVRAIRREGSPQGCLWARCAVSQNILTCHKLQYKEGCRLLQPSCFMLSYSQSAANSLSGICPPGFGSFLSASMVGHLNTGCPVCALEFRRMDVFHLNKVSAIFHKPLTRINQLFSCVEAA